MLHGIFTPKKPHSHRTIILVFLALTMLACRALLGESRPKSGEILFQDDFSNTAGGWNRASTESGEADYADGVYRIYVKEANLDIWAKPGRNFSDVRIEVDAFKVGGGRNNRFGLICRATPEGDFYAFLISSDGYFGIAKVKGQIYKLIGSDALQPSEAIRLGSAHNHIRADCVGDTLALFVNGQKLVEVKDDEFTTGDVGLIAGTYDLPGTDIRFDNFIVIQP